MRQTLLTVEAHSLQTAVAQHLDDLGVLLPILTEDQFALVVVVLVLSTSPVLTTLSIRWWLDTLKGAIIYDLLANLSLVLHTESRSAVRSTSGLHLRTLGMIEDDRVQGSAC